MKNENKKSYAFSDDIKNRTPKKVFIEQVTRKLLLRLEQSRFKVENK